MSRSEESAAGGEWDKLEINERAGGVRVSVHVRPKSSRSAIVGVREGALEVALTSPPADGAANSELLGLLTKALGVRRADASIVVGASSRGKVVEVNGLGAEETRERLRTAKR